VRQTHCVGRGMLCSCFLVRIKGRGRLCFGCLRTCLVAVGADTRRTG
jgi:hypothetical protein